MKAPDAGRPSTKDGGASTGGGSGLGDLDDNFGKTQDAGGTGSVGSDAGCASTTESADQVPASLLFVLDRSGSMACNLPEDGQSSAECDAYPEKRVSAALPSKWEVTRDALVDVLPDLAAQGHISVGVTMFPSAAVGAGDCDVVASPDVPLAPLDDAHAVAVASFLQNVQLGGATPLAGATILSYAYLADQLRAGTLTGNVILVLVTDGAESCKFSELGKLVTTDVPNASRFGIRTFAIGAPGSEGARATLSQIAWQGGTAKAPGCDYAGASPDVGDCHFDMTQATNFAAELRAALGTITDARALGCEFDVPAGDGSQAVDLNKVNVSVDTANGSELEILKDDTAACDAGADGWQYAEGDTKIVLCGSACEQVSSNPDAAVRIVLGCPTKEQQIF